MASTANAWDGLSLAEHVQSLISLDDLILKASGAPALSSVPALERRLFETLKRTYDRRAKRAVRAAADLILSKPESDPITGREVANVTEKIAATFDGEAWAQEMVPVAHVVEEEAYKLGQNLAWGRLTGRITQPLALDSPQLVHKALPSPAAMSLLDDYHAGNITVSDLQAGVGFDKGAYETLSHLASSGNSEAQTAINLLPKPPGSTAAAGGAKPPKVPKTPGGNAGGPKPGSKFPEIKPQFDAIDKNAVAALSKQQVFWIGNHYNKNLSKQITSTSSDVMLKQGLSRKDAAAELSSQLATTFGYSPASPKGGPYLNIPSGWKGSGQQYLEGLSTNAVTVARNYGAMRSLSQAGVTHYEIVNPGDERECDRCKYIQQQTNAQPLAVADAQTRMQLELNAKKPDDIRGLHPWAKNISQLKGSKNLVGDGYGLPPFHFRCRCSVDITGEGPMFDTTVTPPPVPAAPSAGFPFAQHQLKRVNMNLAGIHTKEVYDAPDGSRWIFKPQEQFRALGDKAAADLANLLGIDTAEVHTTTINGKFGSIQRVFTGVSGDLSATAPGALTEAQAVAIQREHAFDWLISQHDTHNQNILMLQNGEPRFIDKGQLFRFFGKDGLNLQYGGPGTPNPSGTYYHEVFNAYAKGGNVPIEKLGQLKKLDEFIKRVELMPDAEYLKAIQPYAKAASEAAKANPALARASWMGRYTEEDFLKAALERKHNLRRDMMKFYEELEARRAPVAPLSTPAKQRWASRLSKLDKAGWRGQSFFVGGPEVENMNGLMFSTEGDGTFMEMKLRSSGDRKLMDFIDRGLGGPTATPSAGLPDPHYSKTEMAAKSFNKHFGPNGDKVMGNTLDYVTEAKHELGVQLSTNPPDSEKYKQAKHYLDYLQKIKPGTGNKWDASALGVKLERYAPAPVAAPPPPTMLPPGWKVEQVGVSDVVKREIKDGKIKVTSIAPTQAHRIVDKGKIYRITAPDGTQYMYQPIDDGTARAARGKLKIWMQETASNVTPERAEKALSQLQATGLTTTEATAEDLEVLKLRKLAFKNKLEREAYQDIPETLPVSEQKVKLQAFFQQRSIDHSKLTIEYEHADGFGQARFFDRGANIGNDVTAHRALYHELHIGPATDLERILGGKTNSLVPTMEKLRVGIPVGGQSPGTDIMTGGADYVFLRVRSDVSKIRGLLLKSDLLRDMDAITYDADIYGANDKASLAGRLVVNKENITNLSNAKRSDETIFKGHVNLEKWLEYVNVVNSAEKQDVIGVFRRYGFTKFAGKDLEDLVRIGTRH